MGNIGTYSGMGGKHVDTIGQSGTGLIRCYSCDSIPLLGLSPQGDNAVSTLSACSHCLSLKSLISEYISLTFSAGQPIFSSSLILLQSIMSSGNITNSSNNGNSADKVNWQHVALPNLIDSRASGGLTQSPNCKVQQAVVLLMQQTDEMGGQAGGTEEG